jgi:hypothetical protein
MTPDISRKTLNRLKENSIYPESEWQTLLRRSLVWIGVALTAGLGAWALSMSLFPLLSQGFDLPRGGFPRFFKPFFLRPVPLIWLVFVGAFVALAVAEFRRTGRGYRHRVAVIALGILVLVVLFSGVFHTFRVNEMSERCLRERLPSYHAHSVAPEDFWSRPDEGYLMGTVTGTHASGFRLQDPDGDEWLVLITQKTDIRQRATIRAGKEVKVVGEQQGPDIFKAKEILPGKRPLFKGKRVKGNSTIRKDLDISTDRIRAR